MEEQTANWINLTHTPPQKRLMGRAAPAHLALVRRLNRCTGEEHRPQVARLSDCCRWPALYQTTTTGAFRLAKKRCMHRLCPHCGKARLIKLENETKLIVAAMDAPKFVTLTTRSTDEPLAAQLKHLRESFSRLRRCHLWKRHFKKGVSVVEITHNPKTGRWHPHLHLIVDGTYCPQHELSAAWNVASDGSPIVHIRAIPVRSDAIRYIAKYATKTGDTEEIPDGKLSEFLTALRGLRTHAIFGPGARKILNRQPKEPGEPARPVTRLDILHDMHRDGNALAGEALTLIYTLGRHRVRDDPQGPPGTAETRDQAIARLLRSLGVTLPNDSDISTPAQARNPGRERPPDQRSLWSGEIPTPPSPAEAIAG